VKAVPTLLFYRNGRVVYRHVGVVRGSVEETTNVIADIIERPKDYESSENEAVQQDGGKNQQNSSCLESANYVYPRPLSIAVVDGLR